MIIFYSRKNNGGYGDRLIGVGACIAIANALGHKFKIIWDEDVSHIFLDYESSVPLPQHDAHYQWIDERSEQCVWFRTSDFTQWRGKTIIIETNQPIHHHLWLNNVIKLRQSYVDATKEAYGSIYSKYLKINVDHPLFAELTGVNPHTMIGIQIRCGDHYMNVGRKEVYLDAKNLSLLMKSFKNIISKGDKIYVTSDNTQIHEMFKSSGYNIAQPARNSAHFAFTDDPTALERVIFEHYVLSNTKTIITSKCSNFGFTAALSGYVSKCYFYENSTDKYVFLEHNMSLRPIVKTVVPDTLFAIKSTNQYVYDHPITRVTYGLDTHQIDITTKFLCCNHMRVTVNNQLARQDPIFGQVKWLTIAFSDGQTIKIKEGNTIELVKKCK